MMPESLKLSCRQVWYFRLKDQCIKADGSRGLVVDVGGNFGWYSLFAAAMGCRWPPCLPARHASCRCCAAGRRELTTTMHVRVLCSMLHPMMPCFLGVQSHSVGASAAFQRLLQVRHRCQWLPATHHGGYLTET